jgi:hypothetical protein
MSTYTLCAQSAAAKLADPCARMSTPYPLHWVLTALRRRFSSQLHLMNRMLLPCRWGNVKDPHFGDLHFYDYSSDAMDPLTYPPAKFVSEFGYLSFPSFSGLPSMPSRRPEVWERTGVLSCLTAFRRPRG